MTDIQTRFPGFVRASLVGLVVATFSAAYFPAWKNLVLTWSSQEEYSHGFLILPLALYIAWQKKGKLAVMQPKPSTWGLAVIIFSMLCYLVAHFGEILTLSSLCIVTTITGVLLYFFGFSTVKEMLFPLLLLLFMIPIPAQVYSSLTIPLQLLVSEVSVEVAQFFGVPIYREGNVLHLPDRTLQVVQACSGLRSMVSILTLSLIFGYFTLKSGISRTILVLFGVPAAILANIARVLVLIGSFYYFRFDLTSGTAHTVLGLAVFLFALLLIVAMKGALSIWDRSATQG